MDRDFESLLEVVLKRNDREKKVEKVLSVEKEDVVTKGDNYGSQMTRVKLRVLLGSGKETIRSVILKELPPTKLNARNLSDWGFFKTEIKVLLLFIIKNNIYASIKVARSRFSLFFSFQYKN
jgi:hypothetical protein